MRYPVTFQRVSVTGSEFSSSSSQTTTDVVATGGIVRQLSGQERVNANLELHTEAVEVTCKSTPTLEGITLNDQFTYGGGTYEIVSKDFIRAHSIDLVFIGRRLL